LHNALTESGALVTTYAYSPLIGLISSTNPYGSTTYYEYDNYGRLQHVRDNALQPIAAYKYRSASTPPLTLTLPTDTIYKGAVPLTATVTGGSGNYQYQWNIKNASGISLYSDTTSTSTISVNFLHSDIVTLTCRVIDSTIQEEVEQTVTLPVVSYPVRFSNVMNSNGDSASDRHFASAYIYLPEAATVTFDLGCYGHESVTVNIGGQYTTYGSNQSDITITRNLPAGYSNIGIEVQSNRACECYFQISHVSGDNRIGNDNMLHIYAQPTY
jgi:YD repeat-containing protein